MATPAVASRRGVSAPQVALHLCLHGVRALYSELEARALYFILRFRVWAPAVSKARP